ncbi:MAG: hypothetical protein P3W94_004665 [Paracoccus sp. (in: a-proteobacteria)]|nr:hypothetical protein [Paracoccus sp. (in: a-proteobacteria)]
MADFLLLPPLRNVRPWDLALDGQPRILAVEWAFMEQAAFVQTRPKAVALSGWP